MALQPAYDGITLALGGNTVRLRPSLRAASILERLHDGFAALFRQIAEFHLGTIREIITITATDRQEASAFLSGIDRTPLQIVADTVTAPILALCSAFIPASDPNAKPASIAKPMPWAEVYRELFRTATGWLLWTAISKARAVADSFGLPYGPFISFCLAFGERRGVQHVMRPCQLIPSVKPPRHADRLAKWSQDKADRRLATWKEAVKQFQRDWLATMTSDYRATPQPDPMVPRGCFGIIGAHDDNSAICRACPFHVQCRQECAALDVRLVKMTRQVGKPQTYDEKKEERETQRKAKRAAYMREVRRKAAAEKHLTTT